MAYKLPTLTRKILSCFFFLIPLYVWSQSETHSEENLSQAQMWMDRAYSNFRLNPDTAINFLQKAMPLFEKEKSWESYGNCLNGLFACYLGKEDYVQAENYGHDATAFISRQVGNQSEIYADALNNLGTLYRLKGNLRLALENYQEALRITQSQDMVNPLALSRLYYNMGIIYRRRGEPDRAIQFHETALSSGRELLPPEDPRLIQIQFAIARVYSDQKDWKNALRANLNCLHMLKRGKPEATFRDKINVYHQLAQIYIEQGKTDSAAIHITLADKLQHKFGPYRSQVGQHIMGDIARLRGDYPSALNHYRQALSLRRSEWGSLGTNPDIARSYKTIAALFEANHEYDSSRVYYQDALQFLSRPYSTPLPPFADILHPFDAIPVLEGIIRAGINRENYMDLAIDACLLADTTISSLRHTYSEDNSKLKLGQAFRPVYEAGLELFFRKHKETGQKQWLETAFLFSEKSRFMTLADALQYTGARLAIGIPDSLSQVEQSLLINKAFYEEKIMAESNKGEQADTLKIKNWKEIRFRQEEAYQQLIRYLETTYPTYYQLRYENTHTSVREMQARLLKEGTALVEYFWGEKKMYIFCLTQKEISAWAFPLSDSLAVRVDEIRHFLHHPDYSPQLFHRFTSAATYIYQQLMKPVLSVHSSPKLIIIPDGPLSYIPFEVLLREEKPVGSHASNQVLSADFRNLPYLIRQFEISYGLSAHLLFTSLPTSHSHSSPQLLAAFSPEYPDSLALTYSSENAETIAAMNHGTTFSGERATKAIFMEQSQGYRILHLSMHGFANEENPLLGYLLFSPGEDTSTENRLYAFELYNMLIPADMVVLAACETSDGKLIPGEGIMSLARAFRYAGVHSMVSSLWKADGRATADIMMEFYKNLFSDKSQSFALRQARLNFLDSCTPDLVHPYYWANHVLIGNAEISDKGNQMKWWMLAVTAILSVGFFFIMRKKTAKSR
ncbi:MAG: CHAT domain-containing tetratricopeptide repeat protein [Bacteroidia bacterium]